MATFYYRAATAAGQWQQGSRQGPSEKAVSEELRTMGLIPVYVGATPAEHSEAGWLDWLRATRSGEGDASLSKALLPGRSLTRDRLLFTQEVATLLQAGVPLDRALSICSELTTSRRFRQIVSDVLREVRGGMSLAESLERHPGLFSRLYVNMVRAGQASGTLPVVFERLAEFEGQAAEWRSHIISSLIYPVLLTAVAIASLGVLMNFVVPRFAQVFESTGLPVPASTALLLNTSQLIQSYGWMVLLAILGAVILIRRFIRTPAGRERTDGLLLRAPLLGELLRKGETARFARTMATLVAHSVPLVESLRIGKETIGNRVMASSLDGVIQGVKRGEGVAKPLERAGTFPPLAMHLLRVGEETGRLDAMFERLAGIYDNETRVALRRLTALFEPVVILAMGVMVGAIVLSLLLAITSINEIPF
ncbi:MAG: type II secretion system F family protein [Acidobacteria bacterium]|nr:type II secretion system F family protein [Acidobacteriota bacterium]